MKTLLWCSTFLFLSCHPSHKAVSQNKPLKKAINPVKYAESITQDELKTHLFIYASDEFQGRETGSPGQKKAVEYLKKYYEKLGIPAAKTNGDYFQKVPLQKMSAPDGSLSVGSSVFQLGEEIVAFTGANNTYKEVVYIGYGIEEESYSDYSTIDVEGKAVLIKSGEPKNDDGSFLLSGNQEASVWSSMSEGIGKKTTLAFEKGAQAILYYDAENYARYQQYFTYIKNSKNPKMSLRDETNNNALLVIDKTVATLLHKDIVEDHVSKSIPVDLKFQIESTGWVDSENVVAFIKGSTKPEEYVIVSSHLDHIGVTPDGQVNNGADDDGSGSVALLEIAQAFKKAKDAGNGPRRSLVFLHVTGEEKGLLGSKYYTDYDPIFPLEQTVADLNIDMVGRIDPKREGDRNYVYLIGSDKLSTELHELSEEVNEKYMQIELDYTYNDDNDPNRFYYRSDHYNFAKNNIPIIFYFNGTHEDYHRPGDTPDKINYDLLENRTRLVFYTAWELANRENRITVDKAEEQQ